MMYLVAKMIVYLLAALLAGGGAGWLLRNIAAARHEEEMQRRLSDARSRIPQLETSVRTRDEQNASLRAESAGTEERITALQDVVKEKEAELRAQARELKKLQAQQNVLTPTDGHNPVINGDMVQGTGQPAAAMDVFDDAELNAELDRLRMQLEEARSAQRTAEERAESAELASAAETPTDDGALATSLAELKTKLEAEIDEKDRLARALEIEQRRVVELDRERELQNKSLNVLHQQLELERERSQSASSVNQKAG